MPAILKRFAAVAVPVSNHSVAPDIERWSLARVRQPHDHARFEQKAADTIPHIVACAFYLFERGPILRSCPNVSRLDHRVCVRNAGEHVAILIRDGKPGHLGRFVSWPNLLLIVSVLWFCRSIALR